jgi:hypothetical protein
LQSFPSTSPSPIEIWSYSLSVGALRRAWRAWDKKGTHPINPQPTDANLPFGTMVLADQGARLKQSRRWAPRPRPSLLDWGAFPFGPGNLRRATLNARACTASCFDHAPSRVRAWPRHWVLVELPTTSAAPWLVQLQGEIAWSGKAPEWTSVRQSQRQKRIGPIAQALAGLD